MCVDNAGDRSVWNGNKKKGKGMEMFLCMERGDLAKAVIVGGGDCISAGLQRRKRYSPPPRAAGRK